MRALLAVGLGTAAVLAVVPGQASADLAPSPSDTVGVGSDTVQNIADFVGDGDTLGDAGYNSAGNSNRFVSFDATPDANDRAGYLNGSAIGAVNLKPLNATIVLRAGENPIQRPISNGGLVVPTGCDVCSYRWGAIGALIGDSTAAVGDHHEIDYIRLSRPVTAVENAAVSGGTHSVQISTDPLSIAVAKSGTNAPSALSAAELKQICDTNNITWGGLGYTYGPAPADKIILQLPQYGSDSLTLFMRDIGEGAETTCANTAVQTVEENDPTALTNSSARADTIAPISAGRIKLLDSGYFHNPNTVFPGGAALTSGVQQLTGATAPDGNANYVDVRPLFIVFRQNDATDSTVWQPGGTKNWAQELFIRKGTSKSFFESAAGQALIAASGDTPAYSDKGANYSVG